MKAMEAPKKIYLYAEWRDANLDHNSYINLKSWLTFIGWLVISMLWHIYQKNVSVY